MVTIDRTVPQNGWYGDSKKTHSANILPCTSSQSDICQDFNMCCVFNGLGVRLLDAVYIEVPLFTGWVL